MSFFNNDPFNTPFFQNAQKHFEESGGFNSPFFQNAPRLLNTTFSPVPQHTFPTTPPARVIETSSPITYKPVDLPARSISPVEPPKAPPKSSTGGKPPTLPPMPPVNPPKPPAQNVVPAAKRALPVLPAKKAVADFDAQFNQFYAEQEMFMSFIILDFFKGNVIEHDIYHYITTIDKKLSRIKQTRDIEALNKLKIKLKAKLRQYANKPASITPLSNHFEYCIKAYLGCAAGDHRSLKDLIAIKSQEDQRRETSHLQKKQEHLEQEARPNSQSSNKLFYHGIVKSYLKKQNISEGDANYESEFESAYDVLNKNFFNKIMDEMHASHVPKAPQEYLQPYLFTSNNYDRDSRPAYNYY
ncbi:MAG: hypothetical protein KBE16_00140 [Alphaproteobacteria bacterium]|nr:hypothetical protein [Alphaproteobacteria bacterium]MBP9877957.1 hypothetical protein [Alphaproteobacteria bacterium]